MLLELRLLQVPTEPVPLAHLVLPVRPERQGPTWSLSIHPQACRREPQ